MLGLEPDQLVHVDEPGAPATLDQLTALLPAMIPDHLDALEATGVIERCQPDRFCIPSPSLLQLAIDAQAAGLSPDDVLALLGAIQRAADTVADAGRRTRSAAFPPAPTPRPPPRSSNEAVDCSPTASAGSPSIGSARSSGSTTRPTLDPDDPTASSSSRGDAT